MRSAPARPGRSSSGSEYPNERSVNGNTAGNSSSKGSVSKKRLAASDRRQLEIRWYANSRSHVLKPPFSGLNCWMDRKTSRKVCWTASSASASLRRMRLAILKRLEACRSNRTVKASAFPLCNSLASASSDKNLCRSSPIRDVPAGVAPVPASETHASEKSALGGTAPSTSLAIRELTLSPAQPLTKNQSKSNHANYMCMHAKTRFPQRNLILFVVVGGVCEEYRPIVGYARHKLEPC